MLHLPSGHNTSIGRPCNLLSPCKSFVCVQTHQFLCHVNKNDLFQSFRLVGMRCLLPCIKRIWKCWRILGYHWLNMVIKWKTLQCFCKWWVLTLPITNLTTIFTFRVLLFSQNLRLEISGSPLFVSYLCFVMRVDTIITNECGGLYKDN